MRVPHTEFWCHIQLSKEYNHSNLPRIYGPIYLLSCRNQRPDTQTPHFRIVICLVQWVCNIDVVSQPPYRFDYKTRQQQTRHIKEFYRLVWRLREGTGGRKIKTRLTSIMSLKSYICSLAFVSFWYFCEKFCNFTCNIGTVYWFCTSTPYRQV